MSYVGINRATERRVLLLFRFNPIDPEHALVVDLESLPERLFHPIRNIIEKESDTSEELAFKLQNIPAPGHPNRDFLTYLYYAGHIMKVPVDRIDLYDPFRKRRWRLKDSEFSPMDVPEEIRKKYGIPETKETAKRSDTGSDGERSATDGSGPEPTETGRPQDDRIEDLERRMDELSEMLGRMMSMLSAKSKEKVDTEDDGDGTR